MSRDATVRVQADTVLTLLDGFPWYVHGAKGHGAYFSTAGKINAAEHDD